MTRRTRSVLFTVYQSTSRVWIKRSRVVPRTSTSTVVQARLGRCRSAAWGWGAGRLWCGAVRVAPVRGGAGSNRAASRRILEVIWVLGRPVPARVAYAPVETPFGQPAGDLGQHRRGVGHGGGRVVFAMDPDVDRDRDRASAPRRVDQQGDHDQVQPAGIDHPANGGAHRVTEDPGAVHLGTVVVEQRVITGQLDHPGRAERREACPLRHQPGYGPLSSGQSRAQECESPPATS
jgi:hypothetical protein